MRKIFFFAAVVGVGLLGCRRDSPARKVIEGVPAGSTISAPAVEAVQGFHMLERYMVAQVVSVTRRTATINPTYPDITGGPVYQFNAYDPHFGQATVSFQYFDGNNPLDPIGTQLSTGSITSVAIGVTSTGSPFNGTGNFVLTLSIQGDVESNKYLTGTYTLTNAGPTYTVICTMPSPGGLSGSSGLSGGTINFSGTSPGGSIGGTAIVNTSHEMNGTFLWDAQSGEIHLKENADTILLLNNERYFFD